MRSSNFDESWTLLYLHRVRRLQAEATVKAVRQRQLSLLEKDSNSKIPSQIEEKALELLVQLLIAVIPAVAAGEDHEQN